MILQCLPLVGHYWVHWRVRFSPSREERGGNPSMIQKGQGWSWHLLGVKKLFWNILGCSTVGASTERLIERRYLTINFTSRLFIEAIVFIVFIRSSGPGYFYKVITMCCFYNWYFLGMRKTIQITPTKQKILVPRSVWGSFQMFFPWRWSGCVVTSEESLSYLSPAPRCCCLLAQTFWK